MENSKAFEISGFDDIEDLLVEREQDKEESVIDDKDDKEESLENPIQNLSDGKSDDDDDEDDDSPLEEDEYVKNHFSFLKKEGLLLVPDDFEFNGNIEHAYAVDAKQRQSLAVDNIINAMPEQLKEIIDYGFNLKEGEEINLSKFIEKSQESINKNISFEGENSEQTAEEYLSNYYKEKTNLPPAAIKAAIENHKDEGDLVSYAKKYHNEELTKIENEKKSLLEQAKKEKEKQEKQELEHFNKVNILINQSDYDVNTKRKLQLELYEGLASKKIEHLFTKDPKGLTTLLKVLSQYDFDKGFVSNVTDKRAKVKAAKELNDKFYAALSTSKVSTAKGKRKRSKFKLPENYDIEF